MSKRLVIDLFGTWTSVWWWKIDDFDLRWDWLEMGLEMAATSWWSALLNVTWCYYLRFTS